MVNSTIFGVIAIYAAFYCVSTQTNVAGIQRHSRKIRRDFHDHEEDEILNSEGDNEESAESDSHGNDVTRQIEEMFRVHSYELSIKPSNNGKPVRVGISLVIESITDISEKNMDLTFTLCIHETWTDKRLQFAAAAEQVSIVLPSRLVQKIWVPDIYIVGSKNSFIHSTTVENTVLRLFNDGKILYSVKITTTAACQMNLYNFPLDTENCTLTLRSLGYNYEELLLDWKMHENDNLFLSPKLLENMPKFRLVSHEYHNENVTANEIMNSKGSKISQVQVSFIFKRYLLSVFFQSYFLAMSMVVLAGLGMWIDPKSVPARVTISVTSVLTLSTIITGLKTSLPKVSYLTAMDIYLWICFLFVFATVLEFCIFNYIMTQRRSKVTQARIADNVRNNNKKLTNPRYKGRNRACCKCDSTYVIEKNQTSTQNKQCTFPNLENGSVQVRISRELQAINVKSTYLKRRHSEVSSDSKKGDRRTSSSQYFDRRRPWTATTENIDVYFRFGYFFSFLVFNGIYWNYYIRIAYEFTGDN